LSKASITHAHNLWLQTAGESGLVGLISLTCLWVLVVLRAWRNKDETALALLVVIFAINTVDYLFFYAPVSFCFWMAVTGFKDIRSAPVLLMPGNSVKV
jgi:O-antigen ligase